ncbi:MAG TPA: thiamine-phosphate kinase [Lacunisphaera sp.]|nr:thiamine-phosphate kinase [Lacunisphaera sp.]
MSPFTTRHALSVGAHGEQRLIAEIRGWLGDTSPAAPFGIGDDCAVIPPTRRHQLVTTDPVIYGQHFDDRVPARAVGAKLLKRNLSDIAAMGGRPVAAVISLALAPTTSVAWLRAFYLGLAACARRHRVKIVGGDITQGPAGFFGAFLTLHGESTGARVITRSGARTGDHIFVTGRLGGSRAGHHYRFVPRLAEGQWLARQKDVVAMMDVSDGIAKDIQSLTPRGLVASVWPRILPISAAARRAARKSGRQPWVHALTDGEDYELLVVVAAKADPIKFVLRWLKHFDLPFHLIGSFARQLSPGHVNWDSLHGYEHLR